MDLTAMFSDDQLAILGCMAALGACALVATLTYYAGPAGRQSSQSRQQTVPLRKASSEQPSRSQKAA